MRHGSVHYQMDFPGLNQVCIALGFEQNYLAALTFIQKQPQVIQHQKLSNQQQNIIDTINNYFTHQQSLSSIPLLEQGTPFQKNVWSALRTINKGEVLTYGQLAKNLNSGARAVANACRQNPIAIVTPCHRVVSSNGLGGYMGQTKGICMDIKQLLLQHEHAL